MIRFCRFGLRNASYFNFGPVLTYLYTIINRQVHECIDKKNNDTLKVINAIYGNCVSTNKILEENSECHNEITEKLLENVNDNMYICYQYLTYVTLKDNPKLTEDETKQKIYEFDSNFVDDLEFNRLFSTVFYIVKYHIRHKMTDRYNHYE